MELAIVSHINFLTSFKEVFDSRTSCENSIITDKYINQNEKCHPYILKQCKMSNMLCDMLSFVV